MSFSEWQSLIKSILECEFCAHFKDLLPVDEGLQFPDPLEYNPRSNTLLIAWAPPGTRVAVDERHFFHNSKSADRLRPKLFNIINQVLPEAKLDPRNPDYSLDRFYRRGLYLVPTIFRRIRNDKTPRVPIIDHSAREHLLPIVQYLLSSNKSLKAVLLGTTPSRAFVSLFHDQDNGRRLALAIKEGAAEARKLANTTPLIFEISRGYRLRVWVSNWPRGQGYANLKQDLKKIFSSSLG